MVRIGFSCADAKAEVTAAKNSDGSIALVALNRGAEDAFYAVRLTGKVIRFDVSAGAITTLVISDV